MGASAYQGEAPADAAAAEDASLLGAFTIAVTEASALFIVVLSLLLITVGHTEHVESALFLVAFAVVLPLAITEAWRLKRSLTAVELSTVGGVDAAGLAFALVAWRAANVAATGLLVPCILILAGSISLTGPLRSQLARIRERALLVGWLAIPLLFAAGFTFLPSWVYTSKGLFAAVPVALVLAALATRIGRPWRTFALVDAVAALLIAGTILDVFFWGVDYTGNNHNFFLGPVNEVLHGRTMLVDVFSQYGVGDIYFLAGAFSLIPIGYGTFALMLSVLTILEFFAIYAIVRVAGRSQPVAVLASAVAVVFVLYGENFAAFDVFPSTGPLRFGLSIVVILLETLAARASGGGRRLQLVSAAVTGLASVWSFEAFGYAVGAYFAVAALELVAGRMPWRRVVRLRLLPLFAFTLVTQILFTVGTRTASGSWPAWGTYLELVRLYSVKGFGALPVTPWSPGLLLGGVLFASALLVSLFAIHKPALVEERRQLFVAIAASTGCGILSFTYFIGRSHPNNLHHIAPPPIVACSLWLCLLVQSVDLPQALRFSLVAVAVWAGFMLVDGSRGELNAKWGHSALGTLLAGGPSALANRVDFLASRPPVDSRADEAVDLLDRFDPGKSRSLVLVAPELTTEILLRADRGNAIPTSTPGQDILSPQATSLALDAISKLPVRTVMLADSGYLSETPYSNPAPTLTELLVWQVWRWFDVRTLTRTSDGLTVSRLTKRLAVLR